jgi:hypothetical protein
VGFLLGCICKSSLLSVCCGDIEKDSGIMMTNRKFQGVKEESTPLDPPTGILKKLKSNV